MTIRQFKRQVLSETFYVAGRCDAAAQILLKEGWEEITGKDEALAIVPDPDSSNDCGDGFVMTKDAGVKIFHPTDEGRALDARIHLKADTSEVEVSFYPLGDADFRPQAGWSCDFAPIPHVQVEYDTTYWGGDYSDVGTFAYIPLTQSVEDEEDAAKYLGIDPANIINLRLEEYYTKDGDLISDF